MIKRILLVVLLTNASAVIATAQKTGAQATPQKNFYSPEFKGGFKYPATWKLVTKEVEWNSVIPDGFTPLAYMMIPNTSAKAAFSAGKMTADKCKFAPEDNGPEYGTDAKGKKILIDDGKWPKQVTFGTITFEKDSEVYGGMESSTLVYHYRTFHDGVCYNVDTDIFEQRHTKKDVPEERWLNQLNVILRTFYFGQ